MVWSSQTESKKAKGVLLEDNQDELETIRALSAKERCKKSKIYDG